MTTLFTRHVQTWFCVVLVLFVPLTVSRAQTATGVGFRTISVHDPVTGDTMPGYVFYPSAQAKGVTWRGPYELSGTANAPVVPGKWPLVVISHGHGGSDLGHHDMATYLASHGFIVATLEHPRDNFHENSGDGHAEVMIGRPIQVAAVISYLLGDVRWKPLIDPHRIGVAGFSNGGYTTLMVVGAVPRFARFVSYCNAHPKDLNVCAGADEFRADAAKHGQTIEQEMSAMQNEIHRWGPTADPRVKAAFVMAPFSLLFDKQGLASINRPVFLYYAANDHVVQPLYNALHIAPLIPTLVDTKVVPNAGHYVFVAPCSSQLTKVAAEICTDPPNVDRVQVHAQINATALAFFRKTLTASP